MVRAVSIARQWDRGTSLASGPFVRRKRCEVVFQGLQAHERKYNSNEPRLGFEPLFFCLSWFSFSVGFILFGFVRFGFVWFRSVWFGHGPV